jgi:hypothetical protein
MAYLVKHGSHPAPHFLAVGDVHLAVPTHDSTTEEGQIASAMKAYGVRSFKVV